MEKANHVFDGTLNVCAVIAAALGVFLMLAVSAQVIARYFFNSPILGVTEFGSVTIVYITFLSSAWVLKKGRHVSMDILVIRLNPRNQNLLNMTTSIICALMSLLLVKYGIQMVYLRWRLGVYAYEYVQIPDFAVLAIIPFGSILLLVEFLRRAYGYQQKLKGPQGTVSKDVISNIDEHKDEKIRK
ncbi:TRAP transporter small permease [Chloroflexota bacterium]